MSSFDHRFDSSSTGATDPWTGAAELHFEHDGSPRIATPLPAPSQMNIAIVGGGVAGIVAAQQLHPRHRITLYEAAGYLGGHTNTVTVERDHGVWHVDTGFVVLNDRNYPRFRGLLDAAGVTLQPTHMGFSVTAMDEDFEYAGTPLGVFCQGANIARSAFWRMLADLLRFNRALRVIASGDGDDQRSLAQFVTEQGYSSWFVERLIVPQVSAVWSAAPAQLWSFPVRFLATFLANHGMLGFTDRPRWQTVAGGSRRYVEALTRPFAERIRLATPVRSIARDEQGVTVRTDGAQERFDEVVVACHADQALSLLADPSPLERELLAAFPYQRNEVTLHTDSRLLPRRRAARQAWNFHLFREPREGTTVTYSMNRLQRLTAPDEFCVSLNMAEHVDPACVIRTLEYHHPVYTSAGEAAQSRWREISGVRRTRYCGAYWGWGFHEDGVSSALRAVEGL
jgi:predicted NAD/FAD-binding protein